MVHRTTVALWALGMLLLAGGLSACGGSSSAPTHSAGAPTDASSSAFCKTFVDLDSDVDPATVARDLTTVGTPSGISPVARQGFEVLVDHVGLLPDKPNNSDLTAMVKGLQSSDRAAVLAFWKYYGNECEPKP
ncbi:MAG TPA: hypothetical protein VH085_14400 [Nocardioides sp.]|nr:hypothetical protein [Nocardioides sp.]